MNLRCFLFAVARTETPLHLVYKLLFSADQGAFERENQSLTFIFTRITGKLTLDSFFDANLACPQNFGHLNNM